MRILIKGLAFLVYLMLLVWFYLRIIESGGLDFPHWYHVPLFLMVVLGTVVLAVELAKVSLVWAALVSLVATGIFIHFMLQTDVFSTGGGALFILPLMFLVGSDLFLLVVRAAVRLRRSD